MKILIIGNGGRESAIAHTLKRFHKDATLFVAPGNAGTEKDYQNVSIAVTDIEGLRNFALEEAVDLTIVGPEVPLVMGIVDVFEASGLRIFGPNKMCAQFEGSKDFTKAFLTRYNVPTAKYATYTKEEQEVALTGVETFSLPVVVKADGLAAGKGVLICETYEEAKEGILKIFDNCFEGAGDKIVIEEFLTGVEASLLCFVDGKTIVPMETARDYKRAYDGDLGLNTGGMGGFSPNPIITPEVKQNIETTLLQPIIEGFQEENLEYKGILFIGLMIEAGVAKVLEFNVRFGDPETQSVLPRLETDLVAIIDAIHTQTLHTLPIMWHEGQSVTVVLASEGYPETAHKGDVITGCSDVAEAIVFHAGTKRVENDIVTDGGRVLAVTALGEDLESARQKCYEEIKKISFKGVQFRTDIGTI